MPHARLAIDRRQPGVLEYPNLSKRQRRLLLMEQHDWTCGVCGGRIPDHPTWEHQPDYGTIDHIVPWSVSRDDSWSNLQPAHFRCNVAKGAR